MINQNWIYCGVALNLIGTALYIRAVWQGKVQPNLVTWTILAFAPMLAFGAMMAQGVGFRQSLMTFAVGFSPLCVATAGLLSPHPKWKIDSFDIWCGVLSLFGLILWLITKEGNVAIVFSIFADGLAFLPTLRKAAVNPDSENPWLFMLGLCNAAIALLIITRWDFTHAAFPVYLFTADLTAVLLLYFRLGERVRKLKSQS